jgi:RibD C-terminal domain
MMIYDLMKAVQDDARRAGERDRLLLEARRARRARRRRLVPAAPARRRTEIVSATLANPAWNNSTVLKGDVLNEVSTLKQPIDGDIVITGSFQLVRTLIEHDLVDELPLKIFPVASVSASACSTRPATRNPCASSTPRPSRAASPTSPTNLSGTPSRAAEDLCIRRGITARQKHVPAEQADHEEIDEADEHKCRAQTSSLGRHAGFWHSTDRVASASSLDKV